MTSRPGEMDTDLTAARTRQRIEDLAAQGFVSVHPLIELLEGLDKDRAKLAEYGVCTDPLDALRRRLLEACEEGASHLDWRKPAIVAKLVDKTPETVREWCRKDVIRYRQDPSGYVVNVPSALKYAGIRST